MHKAAVLLLPLVGLALLVAGCQPASPEAQHKRDEARRKSQEAAEATTAALRQEKEDYRRRIQKDLDELDAQLAQWKARAARATADGKTKLQKRVEELQAKRDRVKVRLDDLGADSKSAWAEVRKGLDQAVGDLKDAFARARDEFK